MFLLSLLAFSWILKCTFRVMLSKQSHAQRMLFSMLKGTCCAAYENKGSCKDQQMLLWISSTPLEELLVFSSQLGPPFQLQSETAEKLATSQKTHQGPRWHLWADGTLRRFWIKCSEFPCSAKSQWLPSWLWTPMIATSSPSVMPPYCWCCS